MSELDSAYAKYQNTFKSFFNNNSGAFYYSPLSIRDVSHNHDPNYQTMAVVIKGVAKNQDFVLVETNIIRCNDNHYYTSNRLFYNKNGLVLPLQKQKIIIAPLPFTKIPPNSALLAARNIACKS